MIRKTPKSFIYLIVKQKRGGILLEPDRAFLLSQFHCSLHNELHVFG